MLGGNLGSLLYGDVSVMLYIQCTTSDWQASCHCIEEHDEYTHDVKAGLSLRWAHVWDFFCLIDAFMFHVNEPPRSL